MKAEERKRLGELIKIKRGSESLESIANKLGTSKQNISRYEKGNYKNPDTDLLERMLELLGISESDYKDIAVAKAVIPAWVLEKVKLLEDKVRLQELLIDEYRKNQKKR